VTRPKPKVARPSLAETLPLRMSAFCAHPTVGSHGYCDENVVGRGRPCDCPCHTQDPPPSSEGFGTVEAFLASIRNSQEGTS
jgi:hypothetical protein